MFLTSYIIPLICIIFLYGGMLSRLWRNVPGRRSAGETRVRATRMVTIVIVSFILLWTPTHVSKFSRLWTKYWKYSFQIVLLLKTFGFYSNTTVHVYVQVGCQIMSYLTACSNPIVYVICSETFRKSLRQVSVFFMMDWVR